MVDSSNLRREFWSLPDIAFVDRQTIAAVRHVSLATIEAEAIKGGGIPYRRIGRRALATKGDVVAWLQAHRKVANTAQLADEGAQ